MGSSFCWNFTERQILWSLCSVDCHSLTLQFPIQNLQTVFCEFTAKLSKFQENENTPGQGAWLVPVTSVVAACFNVADSWNGSIFWDRSVMTTRTQKTQHYCTCTQTVTDPEFPREELTYYFGIFFAKNCIKIVVIGIIMPGNFYIFIWKWRSSPLHCLGIILYTSHLYHLQNEVCEGYVFTGVCLSRGGRAWQGGMRGGGVHDGGHVWQGACMAGAVHGGGACVAGGHVWQRGVHAGEGTCVADTMRYGQWAGGTHTTGMHSC